MTLDTRTTAIGGTGRRLRDPRYIVSLVAATLLLMAAGLKAAELIIDPTAFGRDMPGWTQLALLEFECLLAAWLVSGSDRARVVALLTFGAFAAANVFKVWSRAATCGCLGKLDVPPAAMLAIDVALAAALRWAARGTAAAAPRAAGTGRTLPVAAAAGVLAIGAALNLTLMPGRGPSPGVTVDAANHDFGVVAPGQALVHTFTLRNGLAEPVEIVNVRSNCGCTAARDVTGATVPPGATLPIEVSLAAGEGGVRRGDVLVYCKTAGEAVPGRVLISVQAEVLKDYEVTPAAVDFGTVSGNGPVSEVVRVSMRHSPATPPTAEAAHPAFLAAVRPSLARPEDYEVVVTFDPREWDGTGVLTSAVVLKSAGPNPPRPLPVQVRVDRAFVVEPHAVVVSSQTRGEVRREIVVSSDRLCRLAAATATGATVAGRTGSAAAHEHRIEVLVAETGDQSLAGAVRLEIVFEGGTTPETRVVTVPVHRLATQ